MYFIPPILSLLNNSKNQKKIFFTCLLMGFGYLIWIKIFAEYFYSLIGVEFQPNKSLVFSCTFLVVLNSFNQVISVGSAFGLEMKLKIIALVLSIGIVLFIGISLQFSYLQITPEYLAIIPSFTFLLITIVINRRTINTAEKSNSLLL